MMEKEEWHGNYREPEYFIMEVDIQLNVDHKCMTRVLEESDKQTLFSMLMDHEPLGEMFEKREASKNKL